MSNVPTNLIPTMITQLPEAPVADPAGYFPIAISGTTYKVQFSQIQGNVEVPASRQINAGTGLTGGGSLSADITIAVANGGIGDTQLDTTGVSAGTYGSGANVPVITVNTKGRVTSLSTTPLVISGYVPDSRQVVAGTGLSGGGNLSADRTLAIDFSSATPQPLGSAAAGTGVNAARDDHVHPAVDLSDATETTGVLPMGRGGTGSAMSPVAGAVVVSNGTNFDLTTVGSAGQVLLSAGASLPVWGEASSLVVDAADRLLGGSANQVVYQSGTNATSFVIAPVAADTFLKWNGSSFEWGAIAGAGTVTSVDGDGGTTGLTVSGGPITTAGTLTLGGTLSISAGGTGLSGAPTNGQLLIGNGTGYTLASLSSGTAISVTNATGSISIANTAPDQTVVITGGGLISVTGTYPSFNVSATEGFSGTVTSIDVSSTVSGLTFSGGPVTDSGIITMAGTLGISSGGTGLGSTPTNGQLLIGNGSGFVLSALTAGSGVSVTNATGSISIANTAPDQTVTLTDGTAISVTGTYPSFTVTNTAPDQTVTLTDGTAISVTGTYPSFTVTNTLPDQTVVISGTGLISVSGTYPSFNISATEGFSGTVTSVDVSGGITGITFSGGPVTGSGTITMAGTLAITNGGTGASTQSGARTALGLGTMAVQDASSVSITGGSIGSSVLVNLTNSTGTISGGTY